MIMCALVLVANLLMINAIQLEQFYPYARRDVDKQIIVNDDESSRPLSSIRRFAIMEEIIPNVGSVYSLFKSFI